MPKQSLKAIVRLLRGACPERHEILRYAQNDTKRRARNDSLSCYTVSSHKASRLRRLQRREGDEERGADTPLRHHLYHGYLAEGLLPLPLKGELKRGEYRVKSSLV